MSAGDSSADLPDFVLLNGQLPARIFEDISNAGLQDG